MRVKFQVRGKSGIMQDMLVDPARRHMLALDFSPDDLNYIDRRRSTVKGDQRLILGAIPIRVKTRIQHPNGKLLDLVADRTNLDWLAIELTPSDLARLTRINPGPASRLITYAGPPPGKDAASMEQIERFKSDWPDFCSTNPNDPKEIYGGMPMAIAANPQVAAAFRMWVDEWPPVFHNSHKAPEAQIVLPDGVKL